MGPFIQAIYPKFDAYLSQWASGPLSCVSVFHKYVNPFATHEVSLPLHLLTLSVNEAESIFL
jgi:hypothetical protein